MSLEDALVHLKRSLESFKDKLDLSNDSKMEFPTEPGKFLFKKYQDFINFWGRISSKGNKNGFKLLLETFLTKESYIKEYNNFDEILKKLGMERDDVDMLVSISIVYYNSIIEEYFNSIKSIIFNKLITDQKITEAEEFLTGYLRTPFGNKIDFFFKHTIKKEKVIEYLGKDNYDLLKIEFINFRKNRNKFAHEGDPQKTEEPESLFLYIMKNIQKQIPDENILRSKIKQFSYRVNEEKVFITILALMLVYYPFYFVSTLDIAIFYWNS